MPLKKGRSNKIISGNISELVGTYKEKGKIGNTRPRNLAHARRIAVAIAFSTAGRARKG